MRRGARRRIFMSAMIALGAASALTRVAAEPPATQAASTAPSGDWFGPQAQPADAPSDIDAATFAKLYPSLARADKAVRAATPRIVFDGMDSLGKPQLKLPRMQMAYQLFTAASWRDFLASKPRDPWLQVPDERVAKIAAIDARKLNGSLCLDIETLPVDERLSTPETIDRSVRMLAKTVGWVRAQDPNLRVFLYAGFPTSDNYIGGQMAGAATTRPDGANYAWWKTVTPDFEARFAKWRKANARLGVSAPPEARGAGASLSSLFDGACPSLYIYDNMGAPVADILGAIPPFVRSVVDEAQQYNKPVYPFVCFYLIETPKIVPVEQWVPLLREILTYADGVVLWDGPAAWDERKTLRVRIATLLAERQGQMTDSELYAALRKEFPGDAELKAMAAPPQQTSAPAR